MILIKSVLLPSLLRVYPDQNPNVKAITAQRHCGARAKGLAFVPMSDLRSDLKRAEDSTSRRRRMEIYAFLFVTAVLMPALAVATVGTYGFAVWMYQIVAGPPGPPK